MTINGFQNSLNGYIFSRRFLSSRLFICQYPILFLFTHLSTCFYKEIGADSSKLQVNLPKNVCQKNFSTFLNNLLFTSDNFTCYPMAGTEKSFPNLKKVMLFHFYSLFNIFIRFIML